MSLTFGALLREYRQRKAGLSQARLAELAGYDPAVLVRMSQGKKDLTGPSGRERVVRLMTVLRDEGALTTREEADALLAAAHMSPLYSGQPDEDRLLQTLRAAEAAVVHEKAAIPNNLLTPLTAFIGREQAIEAIQRRLQHNRLVTLTGAGGVGKTRLALEVGAILTRDGTGLFPDGVWLVELAPLGDPAQVTITLARVFGIVELPGSTPLETLNAHLHDKQLLVILDNCEHLVQACAELAVPLMQACPGVRLLATSREPLRVPGEVTWRVPSLSMPDPMRLPGLEALGRYEAVRLFVEHAAAVQPGFRLTDQNALAVAQVCARLDGIPLAIEMAAARVQALTPGELAARLDDAFGLLTGGNRAALPRQQTLRATLDWSYALLSQEEQALLSRLSVFAGGWTAELAEVVAGDAGSATPPATEGTVRISPRDIVPLLLQLVEKSLVVAEPRSGTTRYRMLETVRQYAAERLGEIGGANERYERLADYIISRLLPNSGSIRLCSSDEIVARMLEIDAELDNLRGLVAWARTRSEFGATGLRLAAALGDYWGVSQGHFSEVQAWLEEALSRDRTAPAATRVKALDGLVRTAHMRGYSPGRWVAQIEEALALSAEMDDPYERFEVLALAHEAQAGLLMKLALYTRLESANGNPHLLRMEKLTGEALALAQRLGYEHGIIAALISRAHDRIIQGDPVSALGDCVAGLRIAQETGNDVMILYAISWMSEIAPECAQAEYEHEVARQREVGEQTDLADALLDFGEFTAGMGDYPCGLSLLREAIGLRHKLGVLPSMGGGIDALYADLGRVTYLQGDYALALDHLERAFNMFWKAGATANIALVHLYSGLTYLALGDIARAASRFWQSLRLYRELDAVEYIYYVLGGLGLLAQAKGQSMRAGRLAGAATTLGERAQQYPWCGRDGIDRLLYKRLAAALAGIRDDPATASAWIEGQHMPPEEVVEYALQADEVDEPPMGRRFQ